jgi:hypothetical protein
VVAASPRPASSRRLPAARLTARRWAAGPSAGRPTFRRTGAAAGQPQFPLAKGAGGASHVTTPLPLSCGGSTDLRFFLPLAPAARQLQLSSRTPGRRRPTFDNHLAPRDGGRRQHNLHQHQDPLVRRRPPLGIVRFHPPIAAAASQPPGSSRVRRPPVGTFDNPPTPSGRRLAYSTINPPITAAGTPAAEGQLYNGPPRSHPPQHQCASLSPLTPGGVLLLGLLP